MCTFCNDKNASDPTLTHPPFEKLTDSIQNDPQNANLFYKRGLLLHENDFSDLAKKDLQHAMSITPKEEYALSLGRLLVEQHPDSAIVFLESMQTKIPGSNQLSIALARGYQVKKNYERAIEICDGILQKDGNDLDALILKSELLEMTGKEAESLSYLERGHYIAPADVELVHKLAFIYADTKNKKALALSDSLIASDMNNIHAEPHLFKGIYFQRMQNYPLALKHFNDAIAKDYKFLDAHMYKGETLYDQKKFGEAKKAFALALTITPTYAEAYYWIGKCEEVQNHKPEAKDAYLKAYGLDKNLVEAKEAADKL